MYYNHQRCHTAQVLTCHIRGELFPILKKILTWGCYLLSPMVPKQQSIRKRSNLRRSTCSPLGPLTTNLMDIDQVVNRTRPRFPTIPSWWVVGVRRRAQNSAHGRALQASLQASSTVNSLRRGIESAASRVAVYLFRYGNTPQRMLS